MTRPSLGRSAALVDVLVIDRDQSRASSFLSRLADTPGLAFASAKQEIATLRVVRNSQPDVILVGLDEPDSWILQALVAGSPKMPVIGYSGQFDSTFVRRAVVAGAWDVLPLDSSRDVILKVVLQALREGVG